MFQVENETGEFQVFGPTSSLRHLVAFRQSSVERERPEAGEGSRSAPGQGRTSSAGMSASLWMPGDAAPSQMEGEIDFRRYLPRDVDMTRQEHDQALDQFFRYHASWGMSS